MIYPKKLEKGMTIAVVCASSAIPTEERTQQCRAALEKLGYKVKLAPNLNRRYAGYMAGTGKERAELLNGYFADPEVDAIFCARGGDGSSRCMEYLDYELIRKNPKIFCGYSDITNYHVGLTQFAGLVTFHGPMVDSNIRHEDFTFYEWERQLACLNGEEGYEYEAPQGHPVEVLNPGHAEGTFIGGNMSLLCATIGTPFEVDCRGKILFIEEVDENTSRLDKMIYHLRNAGKFNDCAGIVLGQFTDCPNLWEKDYTEIDVFRDALEGLDIPVMYNIQSGHGRPMICLPMGCPCVMDTETKTLKFIYER